MERRAADYTDAQRAYRTFCAELAYARESSMGTDKPEPRQAWEFLSVAEKSAWLKTCEVLLSESGRSST